MKVARHSPSSLALFASEPALFVLERLLGRRQPVGAAAHRGTAVEAGIVAGLMDLELPVEEAVEVATIKFWSLAALCSDPKVEVTAREIPGMVRAGLAELRPYGTPTATQGFVTWHPEELASPIVGYFDFAWENHGIVVDLKTTGRMPSEVKPAHARQVALYSMAISDNFAGRITYATPKAAATYEVEDLRAHREALRRMAMKVERFLALSDDPQYFTELLCPNYESFYWNKASRQAGFEAFGI